MEQVTCYYQIAKDHVVYIAVIRVASSLSFSVALAICEARIGIGSVMTTECTLSALSHVSSRSGKQDLQSPLWFCFPEMCYTYLVLIST